MMMGDTFFLDTRDDRDHFVVVVVVVVVVRNNYLGVVDDVGPERFPGPPTQKKITNCCHKPCFIVIMMMMIIHSNRPLPTIRGNSFIE